MVVYCATTPQKFFDQLPAQTDILVIGGGIIGISTAYYLAKMGVKVTVCEKGCVAGEQSSRNWGAVRQQGRDPAELPIMIEANLLWRNLAVETGEDLGFRQHGLSHLAETEEALSGFEDFLKLAKQFELDTRLQSAAEVLLHIDGRPGRWLGGMITPSDACAEPWQAVPGIARAAQRLGAVIVENCAVRDIEITNSAVTGVLTEKGRVECNRVLLAGGAWSSVFAEKIGLDIPQSYVMMPVASTEETTNISSGCASDQTVFFRRREDGGYSLCAKELYSELSQNGSLADAGNKEQAFINLLAELGLEPVSSQNGTEETIFEKYRILNPAPPAKSGRIILEHFGERFPQLADTKISELWAGMIDVLPDDLPIMDQAGSCDGLFIATGFSGHGFGIGPASGRIMSDMMLGKPERHDLSSFRFSRFNGATPSTPAPV
ncbi:D-amino-acid oxidase [Pseudovibrio japonicus]|uniref:D-amino-acid oxidase n=1 Tax=Pseudovibrio japonicus TaxID=366534 RepID=A0ABQ3EP89_9HYPH|nr:FAD-binding oxidoreductase [Pseudovibrio japonicus]GHB46694.1 D-amino-acid oxidase [Pseudovibrio japonicus]